MPMYDEPPNYSVPLADVPVGMSFGFQDGSAMRIPVGVGGDVEVAVVSDEGNHIYVAAVHGPATPANIAKATEALNLGARAPLDVLAIAFAGSSVPGAAERKRLSGLGISVVMGGSELPPVARARQYVHRLVSLADESPLNVRAA